MKPIDRLGLAVIAIALWLGSGSVAGAQPPIRIGSLALTGIYTVFGQNQSAADFSAIPRRPGVLDPDVLAAGTYFADAVRLLGKIDALLARGPTA